MKKTFVIIITLIFWTTFLPSSVFSQEEEEYHCEIPNSHPVGNKCYCDDGYVNYNGKCRTPEAVCRSLNAHYSAAKGDCYCDDGYEEKNNYCVKKGENITPEQNREMEQNKNSVENSGEQELPAKQKIEDENINSETTENNQKQEPEEPMQAEIDLDSAESNFTVDEKIETIMDEYYSKHDPKTQAVIKENASKIERIKDDSLEPQSDIYAEVEADSEGNIIIKPFEIPIEKSFELLDKDEKKEAEDQLDVISDFSNLGDEQEVSLKEKKDVMEVVRDQLIDENFNKKTEEWEKKFKEAEKNNKFKDGITKETVETEEEMEKRLKWQIATIKKAIGYEHLRVVETTGVVKMDKMPQPVNFDRMSSDYKEYFDNKAAVDDNEWSSQGVAFNNSVRNITGMSKQLKDLKEALKKQYPREWKKKYLDIPEKPNKEKERKESGSVFDLLEKKMKESKK